MVIKDSRSGAEVVMPTPEEAAAMKASCLCFNMRKASRAVTQFFDLALKRTGLKPTQLTLLAALHGAGRITVNELAALMVLDQSSLSRNLSTLERLAMINTERHPTDRRHRLIELTELGRQRLARAMPIWADTQRRINKLIGEEHVKRGHHFSDHVVFRLIRVGGYDGLLRLEAMGEEETF